jgi:hypothetical protein
MMALLVNRLSCSPTDEGSCTVIRRRFNGLDCFAYMVRDQEVSHSVPLVPALTGRRTSIVMVLLIDDLVVFNANASRI